MIPGQLFDFLLYILNFRKSVGNGYEGIIFKKGWNWKKLTKSLEI